MQSALNCVNLINLSTYFTSIVYSSSDYLTRNRGNYDSCYKWFYIWAPSKIL